MPTNVTATNHKLIGKNYSTPDLLREGDGKGEVRRGLSRGRHAVLQAAAQPDTPRARQAHRCERSAGDARRQGDSHHGRSPRSGR